METTTQRESGTVIVKASGRIDSSNSREFHSSLEAAIAKEDDPAVVLNFENVSYISSAGIRVILITAKNLQNNGVKFVLCSMNETIRGAFQISGFDKLIPIHSSQSEALAAVRT
jgi:anti-anti-sigma factor